MLNKLTKDKKMTKIDKTYNRAQQLFMNAKDLDELEQVRNTCKKYQNDFRFRSLLKVVEKALIRDDASWGL